MVSWKATVAFVAIAVTSFILVTQFAAAIQTWLTNLGPSLAKLNPGLATSVGIFLRNPGEWWTGLLNGVQPVIQQVQANWQIYGVFATAGFTVGVPIFRWLYNRMKAKKEAALRDKGLELQGYKDANDTLIERVRIAEGKLEAYEANPTDGMLKQLTTEKERLVNQYGELQKTADRIASQRDYIQRLYEDSQKELEKYKPKPIL